MAKFNYARPVATAKRLIKRFGQEVTLHVATTGGADPWNPSVVSETNFKLQAAVMSFNKDEIDGTLIMKTDKKLIVSTEGATITPSTAHTITIGGVEHSVQSVDELNPGGTVVYWTLGVRK